MKLIPFESPVYISRPFLPNLDEYTERLKKIWESKWLTNDGSQHVAFEDKLSCKLKVPYVSLFNNGTIALIVACQSLRLSGEVITTPFTFPATVHTLNWNNIRPVFCDIDPVTMNLDTDKIESLITPQTTAILGVHLFGCPCNVLQIQEIADRYGLKVIYDAAHVFGVEVNGQSIGNFGDISMISFHATKIFHTAEGGVLLMKDKMLKERVDYLKNFGIKNEEEVVMPGINGKMSELHAALGLVNLKYIDKEINKRKQLYSLYVRELTGLEGVRFNAPDAAVKSNYQYFVIQIDPFNFRKTRNEVYEIFKSFNIFTRKYFHPLCSNYPFYRSIPSADPALLPVANKIANQVLCMPLYGDLAQNDIIKICQILKEIRGGQL
jgi:dTDP-4-amino-4,6-dideoxygalactose transaminase